MKGPAMKSLLREIREELAARVPHYGCEDAWYSCPKHEDGCANDNQGTECICGADDANKHRAALVEKIDAALEQPEGWQLVPSVPTYEMVQAAFAATVWPDLNRATSSDVMRGLRANMIEEYKAMLAAAPPGDKPE